jgi:hypothetical protein
LLTVSHVGGRGSGVLNDNGLGMELAAGFFLLQSGKSSAALKF